MRQDASIDYFIDAAAVKAKPIGRVIDGEKMFLIADGRNWVGSEHTDELRFPAGSGPGAESPLFVQQVPRVTRYCTKIRKKISLIAKRQFLPWVGVCSEG